jgi:hypothetical protein
MAECIESAQGDPAVDVGDALTKGVFSYGNRLYCRWDVDSRYAQFSWGSADTYSRYFHDYQRFVERPRKVAERLGTGSQICSSAVYIVKLDLSAFFDRIDVDQLIVTLRSEYARFCGVDETRGADDEEFWTLARKGLDFRWAPEDESKAGLLKDERLPTGLPQGLMPSGFFANAYLLEFDRAVGSACQQHEQLGSQEGSVTLHDYCRYVDDLRLVVSTGSLMSEESVKNQISGWIQSHLDRHSGSGCAGDTGSLIINSTKTEVELVSRVAGATSIGTRMRRLQRQLSGPFDVAALEQLETGLNGLLSIAESSSLREPLRVATEGFPRLSNLLNPPLDVRDDTLTRFAAYRLTKSLRHRRLLMDLSEQRDGQLAGETLLQDYEVTARRLVAAWTENPALVQVLRYAFDLFPSPLLLHDVIDALATKLGEPAAYPDQSAVAWYVFAELFRAAAVETGRTVQHDTQFIAGDLAQYREQLGGYAKSILRLPVTPWYVQQQAALLLACLDEPTDCLDEVDELSLYRALHAYLFGRVVDEQLAAEDIVATAIVGYQITRDAERFARWFRIFELHRGGAAAKESLQLVYISCPELFDKLTTPAQSEPNFVARLLSPELKRYVEAKWSLTKELPTNQWLSLAQVIANPNRVFQQENALLALALQLTALPEERWRENSIGSAFDLVVRCTDWTALNDPHRDVLQLKCARRRSKNGRLFRTPKWCRSDFAWLYTVGQILRAAAVGNNDYTLIAQLGLGEAGWYRGLTSTVSKRQLGMLHLSYALGGTTSAVTPWLSGLLGVLLRWPGVEAEEPAHPAEPISTIAELKAVLEERYRYQAERYGKSSQSPVYRFPVDWEARGERTLRVAVLQGLLPTSKDFASSGLVGVCSEPYRSRHRNHTATLLKLAAEKIRAYARVNGDNRKPQVDLVLLPEYAVHVDDQDLLRAFSDDTGAMLHYGLLGTVEPLGGMPTNAARWLIPSRTRKRRSWITVDQGKFHLTTDEINHGVIMWCPYRVVIELQYPRAPGFRIAGAICYDATDLALAADLKNETHLFVVPAMNQDVKTFDNMICALRYHMYQHVIIANAGEFGGSTAQAPYSDEHKRVISHSHGLNQIAVSVFDIALDHFGPALFALDKIAGVPEVKAIGKTPPAGLHRAS